MGRLACSVYLPDRHHARRHVRELWVTPWCEVRLIVEAGSDLRTFAGADRERSRYSVSLATSGTLSFSRA